MSESTASELPPVFEKAGLAKWWRPQSQIKEFRSLRHPIFPDSDEVFGQDNKRCLRIKSEVRTTDELQRKAADILLLIKLALYPSFLGFEGFTSQRLEGRDHYLINILLEYGGSSLERELKKRQNRQNPIVTEEELWQYLWHLSCALMVLEALGVKRYGHMMFYSVRTIGGRLKLMYQPSSPKCLDLALHRITEYYSHYMSLEELAVLRGELAERQLTMQSDTYSLGMMLLNVATVVDLDNCCYKRTNIEQARLDEPNLNRKIAYIGAYYSKKLLKLLCDMLKEVPEQRPSIRQLHEKIEARMKVDLLKREKYLNMLARHHEDSQLTGVRYDLPADDATMHNLMKKMKAEKTHRSRKSELVKPPQERPIVYRGTFGAEKQSPRHQDDFLVRSKINAKLTMLDHTEEEEDIRENNQVPKPIVNSNDGSSSKNEGQSPALSSFIVDGSTHQKTMQQSSTQPLAQVCRQQVLPFNVTDSNGAGKEAEPTITIKPPDNPIKPPDNPTNPPSKPQQSLPFEPVADRYSRATPKQVRTTEFKLPESPIAKAADSLMYSPASRVFVDSPSVQGLTLHQPQVTSLSRSAIRIQHVELMSLDDLMKEFSVPGVYINGNCYYGAILNGRRNGKGLEIFPNNEYYYGQFENDLFHGEGFYYWSKVEYFKGIFHQGMKKEGVMVADHRKYEGSFKNNKRHGKGKAFYGVQTYEGQWMDGRKHGEGIMWEEGGKVFKGRWDRGLKSGKGVLQTKDFKITGQWLNDELCGFAEIIYSNGDIYRGEYQNSQRSGHGQYYFATGAKFEGLFVNNQMRRGKLINVDGAIYEGELSKEVKRHGRGTYKYFNGDVYDGEWQHGSKHGFGRLTTATETYEGEWRNNIQLRGTLINHFTSQQRNVVMVDGMLKQQ